MTDEFKQGAVADEPTQTTLTLDDATEAGFLGAVFDPNPNEAYTVEGVTARASSASSSSSSSKSSKSSKS